MGVKRHLVVYTRGKLTMIMDPSGTGKTTLLKLMADILAPTRGRVEVLNHEVEKSSQRDLIALIGYIPQQLGLVRNLSAIENVLMGSLGRCGMARCYWGSSPAAKPSRPKRLSN
jgi:ABC-type lipoprotein export system ATPase subunit